MDRPPSRDAAKAMVEDRVKANISADAEAVRLRQVLDFDPSARRDIAWRYVVLWCRPSDSGGGFEWGTHLGTIRQVADGMFETDMSLGHYGQSEERARADFTARESWL